MQALFCQDSYLPSLARALSAGASVHAGKSVTRGSLADTGSPYPLLKRTEVSRIGDFSHAVFSGPMVSDDDLVSSGLRQTCNDLLAADADPDVRGHYIEFDTGGGFASAGQLASSTLESLTKPVLSHIAYACSAGYLAASAAGANGRIGEVMLLDDMATVGSIGVLTSYPTWFILEYKSIRTDIYASTSEDKRSAWRALTEDQDFGPTREYLDQLDAGFMALMTKRRPDLTTEALKGGVYVGRDAITAGLADSTGNRRAALTRLAQLARTN